MSHLTLMLRKPERQVEDRGSVSSAYAQPKDLPIDNAKQLTIADTVINLQRTHGNLFVHRLLSSGLIQRKLRISEPDDESEKEAGRIAEEVMAMQDPGAAGHRVKAGDPGYPQIHRTCSNCEEELNRVVTDEEEGIDREATGDDEPASLSGAETAEPPEASSRTEALIENLRGGGQRLPADLRAFFEPRFRRDFSQVRLHTDALAAESARAVGARAFTIGRNIAFGASEYVPHSREGMSLLAHELTHVVQQGAATFKSEDSLDSDVETGVNRTAQSSLKSESVLQRNGKDDAKKAAPKSCACCVTGLKIDNISKIRDGHKYGHQFNLNIDLEYKTTDKASPGDCGLKWEEKTNRKYLPTMTDNAWNDMFVLLPTSPTFDPWTKNKKKPCPGKETVTIVDPPQADDRLPLRTLEFRITVQSSADSGCTDASKTCTAKQVLEPDGKGGIKTQEFTTP